MNALLVVVSSLAMFADVPSGLARHWHELKRAPELVEQQKRSYDLIQKARVGPRGSGINLGPGTKTPIFSEWQGGLWVSKDGKRRAWLFYSKEVRQEKIAEAKSILDSQKKFAEYAIKLPVDRFTNWEIPKVGDVGTFIVDMFVISVVNKDTVIVQMIRQGPGSEPMWITGVDATKMRDGQRVSFSNTFHATRTTTYRAANGARRTVIVLEPVTDSQIDEWRDMYRKISH